ncbi:MAG: hypothetical protein HQK60_00025 [Deltaproteobacteria bacterium]|nr:hypothetical protein [Deltaproteobacteria bacterium]
MKPNNLPSCLKKREILNDPKAAPDLLVEHGRAFLNAGHLTDALDFFVKAGHPEGSIEVRRAALDQGDVFIFSKACQSASSPASAEEWRQLGRMNLIAGRYLFALNAFRQAGDEAGVAQVLAAQGPGKNQADPKDEASNHNHSHDETG